jgi:hypothetical protein
LNGGCADFRVRAVTILRMWLPPQAIAYIWIAPHMFSETTWSMLAGAGRDGVARLWDTENLLRAVLQTLTAIATREPIGTADTLVARVGELDAVAEIPPQAWDRLCWEGSLAGRAAALLEVCGRAVAAAPGGGSFQESRGLARALTGDLAGAAANFKAFVAWRRPTASTKRASPAGGSGSPRSKAVAAPSTMTRCKLCATRSTIADSLQRVDQSLSETEPPRLEGTKLGLL